MNQKSQVSVRYFWFHRSQIHPSVVRFQNIRMTIAKNIQLAGYRMGLNFQVHQLASEFNESYDIFLDLYGDVG